MKKTILNTLAALFLIGATITTATAQSTLKRDVNGNFTQVKTQEAKHDSTTVNIYTDSKGKTEPIFKGKRGGYYVCRTSKNGNFYRKYLKTEEQ
jgi:hypothetical protein